MELDFLNGEASFSGFFQLGEDVAGAVEILLVALEADQPIASGGMERESGFKIMEEIRITAVEGLRYAGVFKFQSDCFHAERMATRLFVGVDQRPTGSFLG